MVELQLMDQEVMSLIPTFSWIFSFAVDPSFMGPRREVNDKRLKNYLKTALEKVSLFSFLPLKLFPPNFTLTWAFANIL